MADRRARGGARLVDVARAAGVSPASASLALNGRPGVLPEKRAKVLEAAKNLGYEANMAGRLLRAGRTGTVGVYLPPTALHHDYYVDLLTGIAETLHEDDLSTLIIPNQWGRERPKLPRSVDGYIVAEPLLNDPGVREIMSTGIPVVCGELPPHGLTPPAATVSYDLTALARDVLAEAAGAGARRPALVRLGLDAEWANAIEDAYRSWCAETGAHPTLLSYDPFEDALHASAQLRDEVSSALSCGEIDALVIGVDVHVASITAMVQDAVRSVGDDLILASIVDNPYFAMRTPSITAVDLDPKGFGARCARAMLTAIAEVGPRSVGDPTPEAPPVDLHPYRVMARDSTRTR